MNVTAELRTAYMDAVKTLLSEKPETEDPKKSFSLEWRQSQRWPRTG